MLPEFERRITLLISVLCLHTVASVFAATDCRLNVTEVIISREAENSGFHRDIKTTATIQFESTSSLTSVSCVLRNVESFSSGVYVDPYELSNFEEFGGAKVVLKDEIDVEKPAYRSLNLTIQVFSSTQVVDKSGKVTMEVLLPVHFRYHSPSHGEDEYTQVKVPTPEISFSCFVDDKLGCRIDSDRRVESFKAPCGKYEKRQCDWNNLTSYLKTNELLFPIPIGQERHINFVLPVTSLSIILGVAFILLAPIE